MNKTSKNKVLLFIKVPPPLTGATMMNSYVRDSVLLNNSFNVYSIGISYNEDISKMGVFSLKKALKFIGYVFRLIYELIFYRPDLVYFQISPLGMSFKRDVVYVWIIKMFHIKILYHLHGKGIINVNENKLWLYKYVFKDSYIICLALNLSKDIIKVYNKTPFIVNNGLPDMSSKYNKYNKDANIIYVLFFSNFLIAKGIIDVLQIAEKIKEKYPNVVFLLAGQYSHDISKQYLTSYVNNHKISNVIKILGPQFGTDKYNLFNSTDIFLFPTHNEAFGNVLLEAMMFSKPCVATREGGIPEIVQDGVSGFLFDNHNIDEAVNKLGLLIQDSDLRMKMGNNGRQLYEQKYTLQHFEESICNVFHSVLDQ